MSIGASMLAAYSFLRNEGALDGVHTVADIRPIGPTFRNHCTFWLPTSAKKRFLMYSEVMVTLMRKKKASEFVIPLQIDTPMEPEKGALARYNVNSFAKHMPTPPNTILALRSTSQR